MRSRAIGILAVASLLLLLIAPAWASYTAGPRAERKLDPYLLAVTADDDSASVSVILTSKDAWSSHQLVELGKLGHVNTVLPNLATLTTRVSALRELERLDFVSRIAGGNRLKPNLDVSVPAIKADKTWRLRDVSNRNVNGSGTIVGVVDSGIDWLHPDFYFPNGTSKILYIWDQPKLGVPPPGFSYGIECTRTDIEKKTCPEADNDGHGTHVTGIAAGTGKASSGRYVGVAPGAPIIFVRSGYADEQGQWGFNDAEVIDGINYMWLRAKEVGLPLVVNLSMGSNLGGHDDTDSFETALNEFAKMGLTIIVSAGNSRDEFKHVAGTLAQGESVVVGFEMTEDDTSMAVDVWYPREDRYSFSVRTPSGVVVQGPTTEKGERTADGKVTISTTLEQKGREWLFVVEVPHGRSLPRTGWTITLTGDQVAGGGRWDAWFGGYGRFRNGRGYTIDEKGTVGVPGTASGVITVGAYITKTDWTSINGSDWTVRQGRVGDLAFFSAWGPTRDGRMKPDVAAPGLFIVSAKSGSLPRDDLFDVDAHYTVNAGTSMAAPHVTGAAALILQMHPTWSPEQVRFALRAQADLDARTGSIDKSAGSTVWGWGKLDVLASVPVSLLSVDVVGVASGQMIPAQIDGRKINLTAGLNYVVGDIASMHQLEVQPVIEAGPGIRYRAAQTTFTWSGEAPVTITFTPQFYVDVISQYGTVKGAGWYDVNAVARVSVAGSVPLSGLSGLLGGRRIFSGWTGNVTDHNPEVEFRVTSPMTLTAQWRDDLTLPYFLTVALPILIIAGGLSSLAFKASRTMRQTTPASYCTNCGYPNEPGSEFCSMCGQRIDHHLI